jgi:hypothetical protein
MANVVYLRRNPAPVAHFLRIEASGHRRLEQLLAAGAFPPAMPLTAAQKSRRC